MKILIVGGTGFISSNVVKSLLKNNHEITLLTRGNAEQNIFNMKDVRLVNGERNDIRLLNRLSSNNKFDAVIDMIAYNQTDSETIVSAFENKVDRVIHMSTVSVYMVSNEPRNPITEDQANLPLMKYWERNPFGMQYGIDKRKCEKVIWDAHNMDKFEVTIVRAPYVCGIHDPARRDHFWIERMLDGEPLMIPGCGDYASQHVYVKDIAKAFSNILLSDASRGKAYNIASEEIYSLNDYLDSLGQLLGRNPERVYVDIDVFEKLSISTSREGHAFPYNTYRTAIFSLESAKQDLDYKSTPFEQWMPEVINFYTEVYNGNSVGYANRKTEIDFIKRWKKGQKEFHENVQIG